jgi:hypothetical protein
MIGWICSSGTVDEKCIGREAFWKANSLRTKNNEEWPLNMS